MSNKEFSFIKNCYSRACGVTHNDKSKKWIIDIDDKNMDLNPLKLYINSLRPEGDKILATIPSKNGYHLISSPFDLSLFKDEYPEIDIHKNNPTNLYIP
jgi:hypothetical protein